MEANILNYGAVADGLTINTNSIQKAIDAVAEAGGGKVVIPAGTFKSGTIWLKSHVELHFENGAVLKASENLDDYNAEDAYRQNYSFTPEGWIGKHFILAVEQTGVSVTGKGVIDASGSAFFEEPKNMFYTGFTFRYGIAFSKEGTYRPGQTMCIVECRDVTIRDVAIVDSPSWCFFIHGSEDVTVSGIKVKNIPYHANTDGIDIDACKNVTVSNCIIDTGDDAIAIRCAGYRIREDLDVCENITITNCVCAARSSGVRISVGKGTIRNVTMSNIVFRECSPAINIASAYNGKGHINVENVMISNIVAYDVGIPISIYENNDCYVKNVSITNLTSSAKCRCLFKADDVGAVSNITLRDVNIELSEPTFEMTDYTREKRGKYAIEVDGVDTMHFDNVRIVKPDDVTLGLYSEENSTNVTKRDCSF